MRRFPAICALRAEPVVFVVAALACFASSGGCGFSPGHDYAVTTTWLLNGTTPDASLCKELGIEQFELRVEGSGKPVVLRADCSERLRVGDGAYGGFVTTQSFDYGVTYRYSVDAIGTDGEVTHHYESELVAEFGDPEPVDLPVVDIFAPEGDYASYSAAWVVGSGNLAEGCDRSGFATVELWAASATDSEFEDAVVLDAADCEDGVLASSGKVLARGNYNVAYVALDSRGGVAEKSEPIEVVVDQKGELKLERHQFKGL